MASHESGSRANPKEDASNSFVGTLFLSTKNRGWGPYLPTSPTTHKGSDRYENPPLPETQIQTSSKGAYHAVRFRLWQLKAWSLFQRTLDYDPLYQYPEMWWLRRFACRRNTQNHWKGPVPNSREIPTRTDRQRRELWRYKAPKQQQKRKHMHHAHPSPPLSRPDPSCQRIHQMLTLGFLRRH